METKFNFNSQICTSREQSERLLALGLKKETADCMHYHCWTPEDGIVDDIPAWSLHRLLELCICDIDINIFLSRRCFWINKPHNEPKRADKKGGVYDGVIDYIEWLIKEGYFNNEYLEEQV